MAMIKTDITVGYSKPYTLSTITRRVEVKTLLCDD